MHVHSCTHTYILKMAQTSADPRCWLSQKENRKIQLAYECERNMRNAPKTKPLEFLTVNVDANVFGSICICVCTVIRSIIHIADDIEHWLIKFKVISFSFKKGEHFSYFQF